ncbi:MAG: hypothetical protein AB3N14_05465 [Flavobacteriaceae bacterium]
MKNNSKTKILLAAIALMFWLAYQFSIKNTLTARAEYNMLSARTELLKDTPRQLSMLKQKESYYDSILQQMDLGGTSLQNNLLRVLNQAAEKHNLKVMDFNKPHVFQADNNSLYTYSFDLKGGYNNILKTIYTLEQKGNFGDVVYVDFEKKKNYRTRRNSLTAKVFVQQVK